MSKAYGGSRVYSAALKESQMMRQADAEAKNARILRGVVGTDMRVKEIAERYGMRISAMRGVLTKLGVKFIEGRWVRGTTGT